MKALRKEKRSTGGRGAHSGFSGSPASAAVRPMGSWIGACRPCRSGGAVPDQTRARSKGAR